MKRMPRPSRNMKASSASPFTITTSSNSVCIKNKARLRGPNLTPDRPLRGARLDIAREHRVAHVVDQLLHLRRRRRREQADDPDGQQADRHAEDTSGNRVYA